MPVIIKNDSKTNAVVEVVTHIYELNNECKLRNEFL